MWPDQPDLSTCCKSGSTSYIQQRNSASVKLSKGAEFSTSECVLSWFGKFLILCESDQNLNIYVYL